MTLSLAACDQCAYEHSTFQEACVDGVNIETPFVVRCRQMDWMDEHREGFELNRLSWDERVETHWRSPMYRRDAAALRDGRPCLRKNVLDDVGDVAGQSLVHLQCHMGMETLSWALLGADAVGLDFSQPAIDKANLLRDELGIDAAFLCANVYDAIEKIGRTFDVVFVSVGALCWLPDVERWGRVVAGLLNQGGRLYLNEAHPFLDVFDNAANEQGIAVKYPYLDAQGLRVDEPGTYADPEAQFQHTRSVEYVHPVSTVINALIQAGLMIDRFDESAHCMWPRFQAMTQTGPDKWELPGPALNRLPQTYTLLAHRP